MLLRSVSLQTVVLKLSGWKSSGVIMRRMLVHSHRYWFRAAVRPRTLYCNKHLWWCWEKRCLWAPEPAEYSSEALVWTFNEPSLAGYILIRCGFISIHPMMIPAFVLFSHPVLFLPSYSFSEDLPGHPWWTWCFSPSCPLSHLQSPFL